MRSFKLISELVLEIGTYMQNFNQDFVSPKKGHNSAKNLDRVMGLVDTSLHFHPEYL
jgi:hypothetical protein